MHDRHLLKRIFRKSGLSAGVFYSVRELFRRPAAFLSIFLMKSAYTFALIALMCILSFDAQWRNGRPSPQFWLILAFVVGIVLLNESSFWADKRKKDQAEYRKLLDFGMKRRHILWIPLLQITLIHLTAMVCTLPPTALFLGNYLNRFNAVQREFAFLNALDTSLTKGAAAMPIAGSLPLFRIWSITVFLLAASLLAVVLAFGRGINRNSRETASSFRKKDGTLYGEAALAGRNHPAVYRRVSGKRLRHTVRFSRPAMFAVMLMVILFAAITLSFTDKEIPYDLTISVKAREPGEKELVLIPHDLAQNLASLEEVEDTRIVPHPLSDDGCSVVQIRLRETENRTEQLLRIAERKDLEAFSVSSSRFSVELSNAAGRVKREALSWLSLALVLAGCINAAFFTREYDRSRKDEHNALFRMGLSPGKIGKHRFRCNIRYLLPYHVFAMFCGFVLYLLLHKAGGGTWESRQLTDLLLLTAAVFSQTVCLCGYVTISAGIFDQEVQP